MTDQSISMKKSDDAITQLNPEYIAVSSEEFHKAFSKLIQMSAVSKVIYDGFLSHDDECAFTAVEVLQEAIDGAKDLLDIAQTNGYSIKVVA